MAKFQKKPKAITMTIFILRALGWLDLLVYHVFPLNALDINSDVLTIAHHFTLWYIKSSN